LLRNVIINGTVEQMCRCNWPAVPSTNRIIRFPGT